MFLAEVEFWIVTEIGIHDFTQCTHHIVDAALGKNIVCKAVNIIKEVSYADVLAFRLAARVPVYMYHITDRITHTMAFVRPAVEH